MSQALEAKLSSIRQLLKAGDADAARAAAQRLAASHADHPAVNQVMCLALVMQLQYPAALYYAERAVKAAPRSGELLTNLGNCLAYCKRWEAAIDAYARALAIDPGLLLARHGLVEAYIGASRTREAIDTARRLLTDHPRFTKITRILSGLLLDMGRQQEALEVLRAGLAHDPDDPDLHSGVVSTLNYIHGVAAEEVFEAHRAFGRALEKSVPNPPTFARPSAEPGRRIRVGFLSADYRLHSCMSYAEPLIQHLDRGEFFVALYSSHPHEDDMTRVMKGLADLWRPIVFLTDDQAASRIAADRIDILIELNGHTSGQRFGVMQRKPAPIQGTYLGYPNTTGVRAIDVRFVDSKTDPPGRADALAVERLVRLDPSFLCYRIPREAGEVAPSPCLANGFVTLGSFNALPKLTMPIVRLWTRLVNEIPGARLVLKHYGLRDEEVSAEVARWFAGAGMPEGRLDIIAPHESRAEHLAAYARIDIGLEPFPYNGTTTTCEAMAMGVPVVTLEGDVHAARVGASLLDSVGMPELIARSEDDYVRIVKGLASDPRRLATIRAGLRNKLLESPLCDAPAFAARFGAALRMLWKEYCARAGAG